MAQSKQREREIERQRRLRQTQRRQAAHQRRRRRNQIIASVLVVGLVLSGVALLTQSLQSNTPSASPTPSASSTVAFPPLPPGADARLATKPTPTLPKAAPTKLAVRDLIVGKGTTAAAGKQVTVNYVGVGYPGGKEFDSSWKRREPYSLQLGAGNVIKGWDQGLVGMKVGGRRQLTIPAVLAYGQQGQPPDIQPNQPLVFVVDLLAVQ